VMVSNDERHPARGLRPALMRVGGFLFLVGLALTAAGPLTGLVGGLVGGMPSGAAGMRSYGATLSLLLLLATWLALRVDGEPFATLGLPPGARRFGELGLGFVVTAVLFAAVALVRSIGVGASWHFWGTGGLRAAVLGLPVALVLALGEELVFRGYGFRQLISACGARPATVLSALAFGLYHLAMAGFRPWGMGAIFVFALPTLGGLLFGVAAIRTGGLALPLGLHLGGNWVQASVLGLGASGVHPDALFTAALTPLQTTTLTAPDLVPQLPYLLAVGAAALVVTRWPSRSRSGLTA
jgi:membrane protease YdiL (CAAX protease family)